MESNSEKLSRLRQIPGEAETSQAAVFDASQKRNLPDGEGLFDPGLAERQDEPEGYHKLSERVLGPYPELALFRRFGSLNMLNLLSLQAELTQLKGDFEDFAAEDNRSDIAGEFSKSFYSMLKHPPHHRPRQWKMLLEIRQKLNEYNATLLQVAQIVSLPQPSADNLAILRRWLRENPFLDNAEFFTWERENEADLVAIDRRSDEDAFTSWFNSKVLKWFHWSVGRRFKKGDVVQYSDKKVAKVTTLIASVVSSILPVVAILILYFLERTIIRLYVTIGLTTLFASCLAFFTSAKHHEIFAATAAFAAVEVVFIGSVDDGSSDQKPLPVAVVSAITSTATTTKAVTSTVVSTIMSTITQTPDSTHTASSENNAAARGNTLALGVGLGVGLPAVLLAILGLFCTCRRR